MTIHFYLRFHSVAGQSFYIQGNVPELAGTTDTPGFAMTFMDNDYWQASIEIDVAKATTLLNYTYLIRYNDGIETLEGVSDRSINLSQLSMPGLTVYDTWNYAGEFQNALYTQPFKEILIKQKPLKVKQSPVKNATHIFKVKWPLLKDMKPFFYPEQPTD